MSKRKDAGAATPALEIVISSGIDYELFEHEEHDPRDKRGFALESAASLGTDPAEVFKTLMAEVDGEVVVAVIPANSLLNLKSLAKAAGGKRAEMLDRNRAQVVTGYVPGGISPLGQKNPHRVFLDESAILQEKIYCSAGKRGWSLHLAPDDLAQLAKASYAPITDPRPDVHA